jgi:hypothetical protein
MASRFEHIVYGGFVVGILVIVPLIILIFGR